MRLTEAGKQRARAEFAYGYEDKPRAGQTTYQNQAGEVTLVEQRKAEEDYSRYLRRRGISEAEHTSEIDDYLDALD